jgi:hypothetical protein
MRYRKKDHQRPVQNCDVTRWAALADWTLLEGSCFRGGFRSQSVALQALCRRRLLASAEPLHSICYLSRLFSGPALISDFL